MKKTKISFTTIKLTLLAVFASLVLTASAQAATYTVTKTADTNDGVCDADCSLREAIAAANATAGNDTVEFDAAVFGTPQTITLGGTQLTIANNGTLTINGSGASQLTVSGNNASRVFFVNNGATAAISGLTVTAARITTNNGGGIVADNSSNLTLGRLRVIGNFAQSGGGILALPGSTINLSDSTVSGNTTFRAGGSLGGGIYNSQGTVNIYNSTVSGNDAGYGGGIYNGGGMMTVTNSTVSGNTANFGAGVSNGAFFVAPSSTNGILTINNATISNNTASSSGGGFANFNTNTATLNSTIIANSTSGGECVRNGGTINAQYTLIENNLTCINGTNSINLTGDPNLGPLAGNGGATQTHALLSGSIAIDAGNNFGSSAYDQRGAGFIRTVDMIAPNAGDGTDIGAFEVADPTPPVITPTVSGTLGNDGWYVSDVQVVWSVSDDESTVSSTTDCDTQTVSSDTSGITLTCSAASAGGTSSQSVTFKRDATAPTLAPTVTPNPVLSGDTATASANASDNLSGLVSQSCETPQTALVGAKLLTCTATDAAGNTASATVSYQVNSRFAFTGFFQPVENMPAVNIATAGQAVPMKFSLGGNQGLNIFAAGFPASSPIPCDATEAGNTIEETNTAGGSTLTYDAASGRYSYVWKTDKAWKETCRIFVLRLVDGSQYMAKFRFK